VYIPGPAVGFGLSVGDGDGVGATEELVVVVGIGDVEALSRDAAGGEPHATMSTIKKARTVLLIAS
jgi:hypothetical protein